MLVLSLNDAPADIQASISACLRSWADGAGDFAALGAVRTWLESGDRLFEGHGETVLQRDNVESGWNDDELCEYLELDEEEPVDDRLRLLFARDQLRSTWEMPDTDAHPVMVPIEMKGEDQFTLYLGVMIKGYSFSGISFDWFGPFRTEAELRNSLRDCYLLEGMTFTDEYILERWAAAS